VKLFSLAGLLLGITSSLLAMFVFSSGKTKLHRIWVFFNIAVAIWGFGCFMAGQASDEATAIEGWKVAHIGGIFVGVFFYHMVCTFCDLRRRKSIFMAYVIALFFLTLDLFSDQLINKTRIAFELYYNDATALFSVLVGLWLSIVAFSFIDLLRYYPRTRGIKRTQTLYIICAFLTGFLGGISTFLPEFHIDFLYPFGNFTIPIYCIIATYAILRYRLMDIHLVFRKSMVYSLSAGILTSLFVVLVISMTKFVSDVAGITSLAVTVTAALIIAILFNPLKNKIQSFIDKSFYKRTYDYYPTIRKISRELTSIFDLDHLFKYVGDVILSTLGLKNIYILYTVPGGGYEIVYQQSYKKDKDEKREEEPGENEEGMKIEPSSELVKFYGKSDDILVKDELPGREKNLGKEIIERMKGDFEPFHGEAVVPVFNEKKLVLLMILGEKLSGDMFTNEDINLLGIVSNQVAVSISNTQLYKEKVHSERLASIGMMSATFAHEIRNPLTSLKTFAQLMPEKYNDEEFRVSFSKIVEGEIERIDGLISDLLDFSTEKKSSRSNNFNLVSLVDETVNYVKGKLDFEKKNINIEKNYGSSVIEMSGDATNLRQAFINIITNGCQAMNGEGLMKVYINPDGERVDVAITDTGEGIHPDDISKIFDPFVTTKEMGIGLGLAISKRIIEDHKGSIKIKSTLSKGTTFTISLPVQN
jgi:two-component system NtrC family sensor kinase